MWKRWHLSVLMIFNLIFNQLPSSFALPQMPTSFQPGGSIPSFINQSPSSAFLPMFSGDNGLRAASDMAAGTISNAGFLVGSALNSILAGTFQTAGTLVSSLFGLGRMNNNQRSYNNQFTGKHTAVRLKNSSADRNCQPILDCLNKLLDTSQYGQRLLEISSGTGQHVAHFANAFSNIAFYPSEYDTSMFGSIRAFTETLSNVAFPMTVDIRQPYGKWNWHVANLDQTKVAGTFDYMLNINMIHITPWSCTEGLFKNASGLLKNNGIMITYGPYASNGILIPDSNVNFDQYLIKQSKQ